MPRCFLAKKSASINGHWLGPEDVTNNNHHENVAATATMLAGTHGNSVSHRSTIGSISAAKAVLSIQEPICPPPAHQASIMASAGSAVKAAMTLNLKEPNNNNRGSQGSQGSQASHGVTLGTQTLPWPEASKLPQPPPMRTTSSTSPLTTSMTVTASGVTAHTALPALTALSPLASAGAAAGKTTATSSRPPRRKKPASQRLPLNLTTSVQQAASAVAASTASNMAPRGTSAVMQPEDYSFVRTTTSNSAVSGEQTLPDVSTTAGFTTVIPPSEIKIEPGNPIPVQYPHHETSKPWNHGNHHMTTGSLCTTPLPPEILANIQPHPPSCLDIKPINVPQRIRTKEETDAAHDLLSLSQSLPPLPTPSQITLHPAHPQHPPTPPTPEDHANGQQYTLIYITTPTANSNGNNNSPKSEPLCTTPDYPLTPPEYPLTPHHDHGATSAGSSSGDEMSLSIIDGRTKKSKNPGLMTTSKDKSKYSCTECGKNYATSSNLSRHKQTHRSLDSGNAKKCHVCGKMYVSMPALSMHILTHNLSHRCNVCGKAFSRPWLLQGHMRSHTGHKPYSCTVCKKSFADRSNLRAHMQTHSPSKNFQCSRCNKTFALKSYLNKHYESSCVRSSSAASGSVGSNEASPLGPSSNIMGMATIEPQPMPMSAMSPI